MSTTAALISVFQGGKAFEWLGRRRVAIASSIGTSVLDVDEDRVEYVFQVPGPDPSLSLSLSARDVALTRPAPFIEFVD